MTAACTPSPRDERAVDSTPPIYPDYVGVTVPCNIAPLNFMLLDSCRANHTVRAIYTVAEARGFSIKSHRKGNEAIFDLKDWKRLMDVAQGTTITITVSALTESGWIKYRPFDITVSKDKIDPYLTYRLIEPDYEVAAWC